MQSGEGRTGAGDTAAAAAAADTVDLGVSSDQRFAPRGRFALPQSDDARFAAQVVACLRAEGHGAYWVGGCVRDLVLGRVPKDYDVATSARPEQVLALFPRVFEVGVAFGVVCVLGPGQSPLVVEVATFRADHGYSDGRRPDAVRFVDAEQDVLRRDFTMNGLLLDPLDATGSLASSAGVVDLVGGLEDLDRGLLRAIGEPDQRFAEDALRLLRAVRFSCRFGLTIEARTAKSMCRAAPGLAAISRERVRVELEGMLAPATAAEALRRLVACRLAPLLLADVLALDPALQRATACFAALAAQSLAAQPLVGEPQVDQSNAAAPDAAEAATPFAFALATLCWPVRCAEDRAGMARFGERFRLSNPEVRGVTSLWRLVDALLRLSAGAGIVAADNPALARILRLADAPAALALARALVGSEPGRTERQGSEQEGTGHERALATDWLDRAAALRVATPRARWWPTPWVDGQTLQARGHRPGAGFREALDAALDAQLRGADAVGALAAAEAMLRSLRGAGAPDDADPG